MGGTGYLPRCSGPAASACAAARRPAVVRGCHSSGLRAGSLRVSPGVTCAASRSSSLTAFFFFSSRRRHTRFKCDWSQTCALPIFALALASAAAALALLLLLLRCCFSGLDVGLLAFTDEDDDPYAALNLAQRRHCGALCTIRSEERRVGTGGSIGVGAQRVRDECRR